MQRSEVEQRSVNSGTCKPPLQDASQYDIRASETAEQRLTLLRTPSHLAIDQSQLNFFDLEPQFLESYSTLVLIK